TATRLTIRWAIERPGSTTGTDMDRQAPFVSIEWRRVSGADRADPLITALPSTELPTQPLPHFRDGVINLGHTAGAHDERVLTARNGPQILIVASRFRQQREMHRLIRE